MGYKLRWYPTFIKQSKGITATDQFDQAVDESAFRGGRFERLTATKDLLLAMIKPYGKQIALILAISFFVQILSLGSLAVATWTISEDFDHSLLMALMIYLVARIALTVLTNLMILVGNSMAAEMTGSLIQRIGDQIAFLSPRAKGEFSSGNLKTMAITDAQTVGELVHSVAGRGVGFIIAPLVAPFILYYFAGLAGVYAFLSMLFMIPFSVITSKKMMEYFDAELKFDDQCTTVTGEWLKHQKISRMMGSNDFFEKKISELKAQAFGRAKIGMYWATFIFGFATRWWVVPPIVLIMSSLSLGSDIDVAALIGSIWYMTILTSQLMGIPDLIIRGGKAIAAFKRLARLLSQERIEDLLAKTTDAPSPSSPMKLVSFSGVELTIDNKEILKDINLEIDLQKKTAIVGQLGAGKSSFLSIFASSLFATGGKITLKNEEGEFDLSESNVYQAWQRQQILVTQEPFVENSTIEKNIILASQVNEASSEDQNDRILQTLYDAALNEDIKGFSDGIHEPLGETGINLSGGQKQRLNLARALYAGDMFLVLDDPMSAVDEPVADHLWSRLWERKQGFIISTHRTKYIEQCDDIIVFDNGRVVERGHQKFLAADSQSYYSRLLGLMEKEG
ncbi:MAG: ABC transporter ATP-binding protein [Pseudobacteriovorax sp.]|nr:ABC transporter ATP-binding protein [Pseudobacteriovorax sp.]